MSFILAFALSVSVADPGVFSPDDVRAGMKAYGLTVFQGDKVERFDLVLLGVLKNFLGPQKDLVIAKLTDQKLELAGVVAGMSGSPIYIDGKLLGALGYAMGAFMKEGICGITPIAAMREVRDLPAADPFAPAASALDRSPSTLAAGNAFAEGAAELRPIAAPLGVSGIDPRVLAHFMPTFERLGFVVAPGGMATSSMGMGSSGTGSAAAAGGGAGKGVSQLQAGSAVSAQLVRGDLSIAATGTVTSVDGNKVLAFGHPFLGVGASSMPMAGARIVTIIASLNRSFKMGEVTDEVGSFTQDRMSAIAGEIGARAGVIPVTVEVASEPEGKANRFRFEVARDPRLTPELLNLVIANALVRRNDAGMVGTVELQGELELADNRPPLHIGALLAMERDPMLPMLAAASVVRPFDILWRNEFGPPLVKSVSVKAKVSYDVRRVGVAYAAVRQAPYRPGETVRIEVGLKPDDKPLKQTTIELPLPASFESGDYDLFVGGGGEANQLEARSLGFMRPLSRDALIDALRQIRPDGPLYIGLLGKGTSVRVGEALLNDVPLSFAVQLGSRDSDIRTSKSQQSLLLETVQSVGAFVAGEARVTIRVRRSK